MEPITYQRKAEINPSFLRVIVFLAVWLLIMLGFEILGFLIVEDLAPSWNERSPNFFTLARAMEAIMSIGLIALFRIYVDHRKSWMAWWSIASHRYDLLAGLLLGAVLISLGSFILIKLNYLTLSSGQLTIPLGFQYILMFLVGAFLEEIVFRGYILDNLLEDLHPILAVLLSSVLFMLLHISNPNLEAIALVNLFLAGVMMSIPFVFTRNLWFPFGLHWAWNFFQGPIFGYEVSGLPMVSLFAQEIKPGADAWTGGEFGFEGSLLATLILSIISLSLYFYFNNLKNAQNENS